MNAATDVVHDSSLVIRLINVFDAFPRNIYTYCIEIV